MGNNEVKSINNFTHDLLEVKNAVDKFIEIDKLLISELNEEQKEIKTLIQEQTKILLQIKDILKDCIDRMNQPTSKLSVSLLWIALAQIITAFLLIWQIFQKTTLH